jgi:cytochrome oxidase Cu insertion factor (SCO1/SenC/PrrC family)
MTTVQTPDAARGRRGLVALAALFLLPVALAFWLHYGVPGWRPPGSANRGQLIDPPIALPPLALAGVDGRPEERDLLRGRWTLLYIGDARCDGHCRDALYLTRQTRVALNRDAARVQRVFIATGRCCDERALKAAHPDLIVASPSQAQLELLERLIPVPDRVPLAGAGRIYVVDPLGNLMLSYSEHAPDKALLEDMKRLLKLSHIG